MESHTFRICIYKIEKEEKKKKKKIFQKKKERKKIFRGEI